MIKLRDISCAGVCALLLAMPLRAEPVMIFAASSLKTALDETIAEHELDAIAVYGGSAAIARQVSQGAQADIVMLAHRDWMDWLAGQGFLRDGSRCSAFGNELVLAGKAERADLSVQSAQHLINALNGGRLAVGQFLSVPAGQYTAAYLQGRGWLEALKPHLAQTSNVRLALALVARGEAPLGFVYASDIAAEPRVRAVFTPHAADYPAITYPMALTATANAAAADVAQSVLRARGIFLRNGFRTLPDDAETRCE